MAAAAIPFLSSVWRFISVFGLGYFVNDAASAVGEVVDDNAKDKSTGGPIVVPFLNISLGLLVGVIAVGVALYYLITRK